MPGPSKGGAGLRIEWESRMEADSGRELGLELCAPATLLGQEGQRTLKIEERITQLYVDLHEPVYRYLLCLSVNPAEADEIVQETFLRLYRHVHGGGREDNLRGWVFRVAHNLSINEFKSRKRFVSSTPEDLAELNAVADPRRGPEELLLRREKMARVHAGISALSEQQKQCLYLRAEGFRYREIAGILEVTISTVVESLRRAIKKLAKESHGY
ncbi:MAG TPA: RNA polymerase sigma factor [Candidatus Acidoferrum sp.]|nr:RNA polymerase sigma factor [Candidatus Acidoferrum sp.]